MKKADNSQFLEDANFTFSVPVGWSIIVYTTWMESCHFIKKKNLMHLVLQTAIPVSEIPLQ